MIVTVANLKGGAGKTTSAMFLAHALAQRTGSATTLVDADPQRSSASWAKAAAAAGHPLAVPVLARASAQLAAMLPATPNIVIDCPPADLDIIEAAVALADVVLVPTSPSALDLSQVQATVDLAAAAGRPAVVLLNRTRRTRSVALAEQGLRAAGVRVLRTHIALREAVAMAFGQPVRQLHGYELAAAELVGALPEQPYTVEAVRKRALVPPHRVLPSGGRSGGIGDPELIARLRTSVARLAT